jgi:transcriptional repressor NrdR
MRCPYCHYFDSKVIDSRTRDEGRSIRRRRECLKCNRRFTTREYIEDIPLYVIKQDGRREIFDRDKLLRGIQLACSKRQISIKTIEGIVTRIEIELRDSTKDEIDSKQIGTLVMNNLRKHSRLGETATN